MSTLLNSQPVEHKDGVEENNYGSWWPFEYLGQSEKLSVLEGTERKFLDETEEMTYIAAPQGCQAIRLLMDWGILDKLSIFGGSNPLIHPGNWAALKLNQIAYRGVRNKITGDNGLSVWLLGHSLHNNNALYKFVADFSGLTFVYFSGHFSYMTTAFRIVGELRSAKKVCFRLGKYQKPFFLESIDNFGGQTWLKQNNSVRVLEIVVDPPNCDEARALIEEMLIILLKLAQECFEYVDTVTLDFPVMKICRSFCTRIVRNVHVMTLRNLQISESPRDNNPKTVYFSCSAFSGRNLHTPLLRETTDLLIEGVPYKFIDQKVLGQALLDIHRLFPGVEEEITQLREDDALRQLARLDAYKKRLEQSWDPTDPNNYQPNSEAKEWERRMPDEAEVFAANDAVHERVLRWTGEYIRDTVDAPAHGDSNNMPAEG